MISLNTANMLYLFKNLFFLKNPINNLSLINQSNVSVPVSVKCKAKLKIKDLKKIKVFNNNFYTYPFST